ncbi:MAG: DUF1223 domain-containing protein [Tepidisphaeraceae bacterium]
MAPRSRRSVVPFHNLPGSIGLICLVAVLVVRPAEEGVANAQTYPADTTRVNAEPFAVVELFTSEGCSSCPPADDLAAELAKDVREKGRPVYVLAFHVDYWDRLGWRDPFGSRVFSQRQEHYARAMKTDGLYTPQMIVNGVAGFVGSDRNKARREVARALKRPAGVALTLKVVPTDASDTVAVQFVTAPPAAGHVLQVALVQRGLVTEVRRGENAGRSLRHENVVREFQTIPLDGELDGGQDGAASGTVPITLPAGVRREQMSVIAYVQNPTDLSIVAAAAVDLNKPEKQPLSAGK